MKLKLIVLLVFGFLYINPTFAKHISKKSAKRVAGNFFIEKANLTQARLVFGEEFTVAAGDNPSCYIFNFNNGFVAVAADDAVFPVLGYSFESNYTGEDFPDGFRVWMENYTQQIQNAIVSEREAPASVSAVWEKYLVDDFTPSKNANGVTPLLSTTWGQGCYYNTAFPEEEQGQCGHLYTGCVATAMAQIMKYYNYPESGTGSFGYNTSYGYVEADFENTVYQWADMEDHLTDENEAVATLMFHSAISLSSQFFPEGTGAYDTTVPGALFKYFKYKPDAQFLFRDEYAGDWKALLRSELDEQRPVLYGAVAEAKLLYGHSLVCDGYQDTAFFHFNWGSGGNYDGYFYLDTLTAAGLNFNKYQDAVVGIEPATDDIQEMNSTPLISVYPNPSYGKIFIGFNEYVPKQVEVSLFDLTGKKIYSDKFSTLDKSVMINDLGMKGTFLLQVKFDGNVYSSKIILLE